MSWGGHRGYANTCPKCHSHGRQRRSYVLTPFLLRTLGIKKLLHVAPASELWLKDVCRALGVEYLSVDLKDSRAMRLCDLRDLPFEDGSFDFIYASHVIEHIQEEGGALKELRRVLTLRGAAHIDAPIKGSSAETLEYGWVDTPELRREHYGEPDHYRYYGLDFFSRVNKLCGLVSFFNQEDLSCFPHQAFRNWSPQYMDEYGMEGIYALYPLFRVRGGDETK